MQESLAVRPPGPRSLSHFPPQRDSQAVRHEQSELLLAAAGALRGNSLGDLAIVGTPIVRD